jgi:serine/threonine protein kinase
MIGTIIKEQYRVLDLIGEGGMGIVFKALDMELERQVALKFLKAELGNNSLLIQRFRDELRTLAGFNHPNITTLFTSLTWEARPVMVMELVEGQTLNDMVADRGPIPSQVCVPLIKQALAGVALAHRRKIIHRDIKPANLMLNTDGVVKVMDFGIAKIQNAPGLTRSNAGIGTSYYMAPEQIRGTADARSDIYAMGVTLYELLAGQVPFQGASQYDIEHAHISEIPKPPTVFYPHIPPSVVNAVMRSLEKDPGARFQTADEFSAALSDGAVIATPSSLDTTVVTNRPVFGGMTPPPTPAPHVTLPGQGIPEPDQATPSHASATPTTPSGQWNPSTSPQPGTNPDGRIAAHSPNRVLSTTLPGTDPVGTSLSAPAGSTADAAPQYPWPEQTPASEADVPPVAPDRKKLIFAAAAVLLLGGASYGIYTLLKPPPPPPIIVYNQTHGGGGTSSGKKGDQSNGTTGGSGQNISPPPGPSSNIPSTGSGPDPVFTLPGTDSAPNRTEKVPVHASVPTSHDALSGNWAGKYQNLCSNAGSTQVKMNLSRKTDQSISGNMSFSGQGGVGGSCSLRGKFHPADGSLTLSPMGCGGTVPNYFQGNHLSALMFSGNSMSGSVSPEDNSTCVQVSLAKTN